MPTLTPTYGTVGLLEGQKEAGQRVDFKPDKFVLAIETKGYRLAWSRACLCPCASVNDQTEQPDPNCELCEGVGFLYFGNGEAVVEDTVGELDDVQKAILARDDGMVIRGIMTRMDSKMEPYGEIGRWKFGTSYVTVRSENKLGYYDRLVNLDSETTYSEMVTAGDPDELLDLRYLATGVNLLRSEDQVYTPTVDYDLVAGKVRWLNTAGATQPDSGTKLAVHYLMHPTWVVIEYPHMIRTTPVKFKSATPITPQGNPEALPVQAMVKYEFLL